MSTSIGPGELICPICGGAIHSDFECANGHTLFEIGNAVKELERQLETDKILTDEPLKLQELGCSTAKESYHDVDYERATLQYETTETKTPLLLGRRQFLQDAVLVGIGAVLGTAGSFAAARHQVKYQKGLEETITAEELAQFRQYEHDRENLKQWSDVCNKPSLKRLLHLQIGLLDGSDLRSMEASAKDLAASQTGPARARTFIQYAKILHLTSRPAEAVTEIIAAINKFDVNDQYDLRWQLIASNVAALDAHDIATAPEGYKGTVKTLHNSIDAAFEILFPHLQSQHRLKCQQKSLEALKLVQGLENPNARELAFLAAYTTVYLNIMRNHQGQKRGLEEAQEAIQIAENFGKIAPRHGWNVMNVTAGLYWHLGRLEEALLLSNRANSYFGQQGDERMQIYAVDQRRGGGLEFIIFGTIRARLLLEKAAMDKKTRESLMGECRELGSLLSKKKPNEIRIGTLERSRQLILAEVEALDNRTKKDKRTKKAPINYAFSETKATTGTSHVLYGAMPIRGAAIERIQNSIK